MLTREQEQGGQERAAAQPADPYMLPTWNADGVVVKGNHMFKPMLQCFEGFMQEFCLCFHVVGGSTFTDKYGIQGM